MVYNSFFFLPKVSCTLFKILLLFFLFFVKLWLILSKSELSRTELPKCSPSILMKNCHLSCFISSFIYDLVNKALYFQKFVFEIETSYSFKIACILVRQLIPLEKNGGVFGKIYCLISWSPICTPLILGSASVKMVATSATVM